MNILHIGLTCHFTEGMLYQDNVLVDLNVKDGHNVTYISDCYYYDSGKLVKNSPEDITLKNGARLIRLDYDKIINEFVSSKIQKVTKLKALISEINPDVILYHDFQGYALIGVKNYVKSNPNTIFYADNHADFYNSARNWMIRFLYKIIHGYFIRKALPYVKKVFYISLECKEYLQDMYKIPENKLEYYPLGGIVLPMEKQKAQHKALIEKYNLNNNSIICAHSGKLVAEKKTKDLLNAFYNVKDERLVLFIFGNIPENQKEFLDPLIKRDNRVHFLGWKMNDEIPDILAGCDLYCQPGTGSATLQTAICAGAAVMLFPYPGYKFLLGDSAFWISSVDDMSAVFNKIIDNGNILTDMKLKTNKIAKEVLDYEKIAHRLYQ